LDLFLAKPDGGFDVGYDVGAKLGISASMLVIDEYSGLPDDPQVLVTYYESPGLESSSAPACAGDAGIDGSGDSGSRPTWSGCDTWKIARSFLPDAKIPAFLTREAYVSGGVLVARFSTISFRIGTALLRMTDPVVTARITNDQMRTLTGGVIAGRVDADEFVRAFGERTFGESPLCRQNEFYTRFKTLVCSRLDVQIPANSRVEPCNGLSMTFEFEAVNGFLGSVVPDKDVGQDPCAGVAARACP